MQVDRLAGYSVARSDRGADVLWTAVDRVQEEPIRACVRDLPGSGAARAHDVRTGSRYLESTGRVGEEARVRSAARGRGQDLARGPDNVELHRSRRLYEGVVFRPRRRGERELVHIARTIDPLTAYLGSERDHRAPVLRRPVDEIGPEAIWAAVTRVHVARDRPDGKQVVVRSGETQAAGGQRRGS